jgi:hypothetical protein
MLLRVCLVVLLGSFAGCHCGGIGLPPVDDYHDAGNDAADGGDLPCGVDCSEFKAPACMRSVCNTGEYPGPKDVCTMVPAVEGTACDDGKFCTIDDFCSEGTCVGGKQNTCGKANDSCSSIICYEESQTCASSPINDGKACEPSDKCTVNGTCVVGTCVGVAKDCSGSPLAECNQVSCDPTSGLCVGTPDSDLDGNACVLTGNPCDVNKACLGGQCVGGVAKDCSSLDVACALGSCDPTSGMCLQTAAPVGTTCSDGVEACQTGACDGSGKCVATVAPDGSTCNDHNACTQADTCSAGNCNGTPVAGCTRYLAEGFESCSTNGWTLAGDWQCGTPTAASPVKPFDGTGVLATQLDGSYDNNQTFAACTATSPTIDLTTATHPTVLFWAWSSCEVNDGWILEVSANGGQTYPEVTAVTPAYSQTIDGLPAYAGDLSASGWQPYSADLSAWAGQTVTLRFAFYSDPKDVGPGVYIDDLVIAEPTAIPLYITTPASAPLPNAYVGKAYSTSIAKVGGSAGSVWSIVAGGTNTAWLSIDPATGTLSGTPSSSQAGPVTVTIRVQEPTVPSNYDEQTYTFDVIADVYYTSFEGACPDGWALVGDWKCGVPTAVGPATAYDGKQCIGAGLGTGYSNNDSWTVTTASSPAIDLGGVLSPMLTFRMWVDTEGGTNDGANLQISTDSGTTFQVVETATPAYPLMIAGEGAWGGHQSALGWQLVQVDLTTYAGKTVVLRFGFQSDASNTFAGFYVDDFLIQ